MFIEFGPQAILFCNDEGHWFLRDDFVENFEFGGEEGHRFEGGSERSARVQSKPVNVHHHQVGPVALNHVQKMMAVT